MTTNATAAKPPAAGLESVVAGDSSLSFVDGEKGKLVYRGYDIKDLAERATFEECVHLLWYDALPTRAQLDAFRDELRSHATLPDGLLDVLRTVAGRGPLMDALRTGVSALSAFDDEETVPVSETKAHAEQNLRRAKRVQARIATIVATVFRLARGEEPVAPRDDLGYAADFLHMATGVEPGPDDERIFDAALTLHADHGFNASTFAARVTAATESDVYAALTSAVGTLAGPLHGGANARVMAMLEEIGDIERANAYVDEILSRPKGRVMGFGHRVYKVEDPRATVLRSMSETVTERTGNAKWFRLSRRVEDHVRAVKGLNPNVDFYSASVYAALGLPKETFTPIFAISRTAGWLAHVMEQHANNRLIRPRANYVGPASREFVPLAER